MRVDALELADGGADVERALRHLDGAGVLDRLHAGHAGARSSRSRRSARPGRSSPRSPSTRRASRCRGGCSRARCPGARPLAFHVQLEELRLFLERVVGTDGYDRALGHGPSYRSPLVVPAQSGMASRPASRRPAAGAACPGWLRNSDAEQFPHLALDPLGRGAEARDRLDLGLVATGAGCARVTTQPEAIEAPSGTGPRSPMGVSIPLAIWKRAPSSSNRSRLASGTSSGADLDEHAPLGRFMLLPRTWRLQRAFFDPIDGLRGTA